MKKVILLAIVCFSSILSFSQTDGISYQAVIIDNNVQEIPGVDIPSNNLPNTPLQVQFSIINNTNSIEYQESHNTTTDAFGMINLMIGQGNPTVGAFNQIYWNNDKFLKVEIDLNDGNGLVEFSYQELTYIPYVKHREIIATSTLDVDGATNLNNNFTVNNQSPSLLTGDLTVEGVVSFDGGLDVGGDTQLYADLTVDGITNLNDNLFVNNGATTNLSGDLFVTGQANFNDGNFQNISVTQSSNLNLLNVSSTSNLNGQVNIIANPGGNQDNLNSYPLKVSGSNLGIGIKVNGLRNANKNFITFFDDNGVHGAIEGQTLSELQGSFRFIWDQAMAGLEQAFTLAEQIACGVQLDLAESGVMLVNNFVLGAKWIELTVNSTNSVGVYYKSGGADYAEFLEKTDVNEIFYKGDIVGVFGGKISKKTEDANHIMVISTNPIIVGNMVDASEEKNFEKVGFLGQVPVRVVGKVSVGDYILPSGNNDGIGIAVSPTKMKIEDYKSILGVAWESSKNNSFNYINVAIGINTNDISIKVAQQQKEIDEIKSQLNEIMSKLNGKNDALKSESQVSILKPHMRISNLNEANKLLSPQEFEAWLQEYGYIFEIAMNELKTKFRKKGIIISQYPEVKSLIENPKETLRKMYNGEYMPTLWKSFSKRYPKAFNSN